MAHGKHPPMPELLAYVSGAQLKHLVAPDGEKVPAPQVEHAMLAEVLVNFPAAHAEHTAKLFAPSMAEEVPVGQSSQTTDPVLPE